MHPSDFRPRIGGKWSPLVCFGVAVTEGAGKVAEAGEAGEAAPQSSQPRRSAPTPDMRPIAGSKGQSGPQNLAMRFARSCER